MALIFNFYIIIGKWGGGEGEKSSRGNLFVLEPME